MGTRKSRLNEAVLAGTRGLCPRSEKGGIMNTPVPPSFTI